MEWVCEFEVGAIVYIRPSWVFWVSNGQGRNTPEKLVMVRNS